MYFLADRVKVATDSLGTGTIVMSAAVPGYQTFADAAIPNGAQVRYLIIDGDDWEIGVGTYSDEDTGELTRSIVIPGSSSSTDALLDLSGNATVAVIINSYDLLSLLPTGELLVNNDFESGGSWSTNSNYSIHDGKLYIDDSLDGDSGVVTQLVLILNGAFYDTVLKIDAITAGSVRLQVGDSAGASLGTSRGAAGTYNEQLTGGANDYFRIAFTSGTVAEIDLVSLLRA